MGVSCVIVLLNGEKKTSLCITKVSLHYSAVKCTPPLTTAKPKKSYKHH